MDRIEQPIVFLDTHIVCWLHDKLLGNISELALKIINNAMRLKISPIVDLEMTYLHEIGRLQQSSEKIISKLHHELGLELNDSLFSQIISHAKRITWTRDVFDRLIVAECAYFTNACLVTKDEIILKNFKQAVWQ